jgi:hypothetical protein
MDLVPEQIVVSLAEKLLGASSLTLMVSTVKQEPIEAETEYNPLVVIFIFEVVRPEFQI